MLGMLYSIEDNNRVTAAWYPEGTGRIDDRSVKLTGMGDLTVAYSSQDKQMYFSFAPKGGYWSTLTSNTPDAKGRERATRLAVRRSSTTTIQGQVILPLFQWYDTNGVAAFRDDVWVRLLRDSEAKLVPIYWKMHIL
jgi:hypothetical protein